MSSWGRPSECVCGCAVQAGALGILQSILDTGMENVATDRAKYILTWMTVGADQDDFRAPKGEKTFEGSLSCNNVNFLSGHLFKEPCARRPMPWHHACGRHPRHNVFLAFVYIKWSTPTDSSTESVLGTTTSKLTVKLRSPHMCCTLAASVGLCFTQSCCETAIWLWSQRRNQLQNPLQLSNRWHQAGQAKQRWSLNGSMVRKSAKSKSRNSRCNGRGEGTIQQLDVVLLVIIYIIRSSFTCHPVNWWFCVC